MESIYDSLNNIDIVGTIREDVTSKGGHEGPAVNDNIRLSGRVQRSNAWCNANGDSAFWSVITAHWSHRDACLDA